MRPLQLLFSGTRPVRVEGVPLAVHFYKTHLRDFYCHMRASPCRNLHRPVRQAGRADIGDRCDVWFAERVRLPAEPPCDQSAVCRREIYGD